MLGQDSASSAYFEVFVSVSNGSKAIDHMKKETKTRKKMLRAARKVGLENFSERGSVVLEDEA